MDADATARGNEITFVVDPNGGLIGLAKITAVTEEALR